MRCVCGTGTTVYRNVEQYGEAKTVDVRLSTILMSWTQACHLAECSRMYFPSSGVDCFACSTIRNLTATFRDVYELTWRVLRRAWESLSWNEYGGLVGVFMCNMTSALPLSAKKWHKCLLVLILRATAFRCAQGIIILRVDAPIYFANVDFVKDKWDPSCGMCCCTSYPTCMRSLSWMCSQHPIRDMITRLILLHHNGISGIKA